MIIAIIYIFLSYMISDQPLKVTFSKSSAPPEKNHSPFLLTPPFKKCKSPPFASIENFSAPPPPPLSFKGGGEDTVSAVYHRK